MQPTYDLDKIKFATDGPTFEKAVGLYESGKVTQFEEGIGAYSAIVQGSQPYRVLVEACRYDCGHCECYLGQNDTLCKRNDALYNNPHFVSSPFPRKLIHLILEKLSCLSQEFTR